MPDAGMPDEDAGMPDEDAGMPDEDAGMPEACTYTQGFYRNHADEWPVTSLTIAGEVYTQAQLLDLYAMSTMGDISIALAHQVITAMLNVANGAPAPSALTGALLFLQANADADGRLPFGFVPGSSVHAAASVYIDALAAFNEGRAGTPHCDLLEVGGGLDPDRDMDVDETIDEDIRAARD
jgi:hypothetical protein